MLCSHMLLQGHLCVAHSATVGTCEGLGLLHREGFTTIVQVWEGINTHIPCSVSYVATFKCKSLS